MFGLDTTLTILLIICILAVCAFEFINGFHDTANAVATVIYTNSLKPWVAVVWSAIWNSIGVFLGGIAVAVGIINLLPVETLIDQNIMHSIGMVLALLLTAIIWNLGTWYFGIPCSSSHTLIGSILGVGLAYSLLPESLGASVNWQKAKEIGISLFVSPALGFTFAIILMFTMKKLIANKHIFQEPDPKKKPPLWIRTILIITCTGVSFSHGSNDGQKGVGLMMLVLIGIVPSYFALDFGKDLRKIESNIEVISTQINILDKTLVLNDVDKIELEKVKTSIASLDNRMQSIDYSYDNIYDGAHFLIRKDILIVTRTLKGLLENPEIKIDKEKENLLKAEIKSMNEYTDYAPQWVIIIISISLGLGTMIGWKRIVKTIGEKIGKQHLTYAQGATSEVVAASTIGLSTLLGLPVSTTHVLSSGIAGSMVASKGLGNLQPKTIKNILIAWLLTLPVSMGLSGALFLLFRAIL